MEESIKNNVSKRREGEYSTILTIPANSSKSLNLKKLSEYAPFLNAIFRNINAQNIKYYLNNGEFFNYLVGGEVRVEEASNFFYIEFENENSVDVDIVLEFSNKVTQFELEKLKVGVMKYATR